MLPWEGPEPPLKLAVLVNVIGPDAPAVCLDGQFAKGQTQSTATVFLIPRRITLKQPTL
jgi:hypothetical protein